MNGNERIEKAIEPKKIEKIIDESHICAFNKERRMELAEAISTQIKKEVGEWKRTR